MIVYVVSGSPASIASCLQGTGVGRDAWMELRTTTRLPPAREKQEQDVVVIDLLYPSPGLCPPNATKDHGRLYVLVVARQQSIPVAWVEFAILGSVELLTIEPNSLKPFAPVAAAVERLRGRAPPPQVAGEVVMRNPCLRDLEDLVSTVLSFPWQIRQPRDLAFRAGIQRSVLRAQCARIGLQRVEHFITLVRWLAFEFLTGTREMSAGRARVVVGISDPSNFRRQLGRLGYYGHAQRPDGNMLSARNR